VFWVKDEAFPVIVEGGAGAEGILVQNLTDADIARLDFYEGGFAYLPREVAVGVGAQRVMARIYFPEPKRWTPGAAWQLSDWVISWGATAVATARDVMRHFGARPPAAVLARYPLMLMRGGARVRAEEESDARAPDWQIRRRAGLDDVIENHWAQVYANYFSVEEYDLRFRRFDGTMSQSVNRAIFLSGDASVVLPYDPVRDRVLVIEQFRMGPYGRGDLHPWLLEAIAGRVDGGETPETAAYREAREEAGLNLCDLIPVAHYYPSPAAKSEYLYTYLGLADLPDGAAGLGGLATEVEDIRAHLLSFDTLIALVDSSEIDNAPLIILANWLARNRARLRSAPGGA
jgi:nudix-type nucleoside diphosphatase (YffH/AdpP family)